MKKNYMPYTWHPTDFEVFLELWNLIQKQETPRLHRRIASWLQRRSTRGEKRLLLQAFRASGKSSLVGLLSAWLLTRDPDMRILVLAAESSLATKMVRNIRGIIEKHPLTTPLRPKTADQWAADRFTVNRLKELRDPSVMGAGLYSNITGTRADMIICDDVEVPNTCGSPEMRRKLRERLSENEFILVPGGTILYIGTPHCYETIYADAPRDELGETEVFLKDYHRFSVPVVDEQGVSAWPERFKPEEIERQRKQVGPMKFAAQMMLEPVNLTQARLDVSLLQAYAMPLVAKEIQQRLYLSIGARRIVSCSAWWDPAFGKGGNDSSVLAVVFTDEEGDCWLHQLSYLSAEGDEDEATNQCRQAAKIARDFYLPAIAVETNGIGKFLPGILKNVLAEEKIPCAVIEKNSTQSKELRILEGFDAIMAARALHVHEGVYQTPFIREMSEWQPKLSGARDDGLDAVAGALSCEPVRLKRRYFGGRSAWQGAGQFHAAQTNFNPLGD